MRGFRPGVVRAFGKVFYGAPRAYPRVMRVTIAVNPSFFNAQRMLLQYLRNAYQSIEIDLSAAEAEEREESQPKATARGSA